jgi:hypothetical protein
MDRRDFLKTSLASSGLLVLGNHFNCSTINPETNIFPKGTPPRKILALQVPKKLNWHEAICLTSFQGLINRRQTRIYLVQSKVDQFWLEHYREKFNTEYEIIENQYELMHQFRNELSGYLIYDPQMPHSINLATVMGSLQNALTVHPDEEYRLQEIGLKPLDDLRGRWQHYLEAYEWGLKHLQPQCNQKIIANLCVHHPHWPTSTVTNRDYIMAHKIFAFDLSTSERDKADYYLAKKIYQAYPPGAAILGWHCVRDKEHEAIALSAHVGHYGICSLNTPNLTVHSGIKLKKNRPFTQRSIPADSLKVEDKVYVAFMATDGDAAWFMQNLIKNDWANSSHGRFKYNWGFLPLAYQLMPGTVQYYLENRLPTDYFVAGPAGATYTYPHLHPNPEPFLKLSRHFMHQCGLRTVHMTNWNDRDWWQEADVPGFHDLLKKNLPECIGFVRGMGESAFEKNDIAGGQPYIFCGEGLHQGDDIHLTLKNFINACPNRPLFIYCLVNHAIPMNEVHTAVKRFPDNTIEAVHLDELLLLIEKAFNAGRITEELYPEKIQLWNIAAKEAAGKWDEFVIEILQLKEQISDDEATYVAAIQTTLNGLENINPADFLAFTIIWHAMTLVKLNLESRFIYVNHKPTATKNFLKEFEKLPDVKIIAELQELWNNWHQTELHFLPARELALRFIALTEKLADLYQLDFQG